MPGNLLQIVESTTLDAEEIAARTRSIHAAVLSKSKCLDGPNFKKIHRVDLELLFGEYDNKFFDGQIKNTLDDVEHQGVVNRINKRATVLVEDLAHIGRLDHRFH